jgi:3-methyladenine DNA glycosylase AlkD
MPRTKRSSPKRTSARRSTPRASIRQVLRELREAGDPKRAANLAWFFKTGEGEYAEGDRFIGIPVPVQRRIAHRFLALSPRDIARLMGSPIHEHRFVALEILVAQYERGDGARRREIFDFFLSHTRGINNWDLVDTSAPYIVGEHLRKRPRGLLDRLAASQDLWERRIAIISTLALIRAGEIADTYRIARKLLGDRHDLIHKAVGWALRETMRVSPESLLNFLRDHYASLPRTTLRYAIEKFPAAQRKRLLAGQFS